MDAFLDWGAGVCLLAGEEIVAEAYAPYIGRDTAEVGAVTAEGHRGRGDAGIATALLAEQFADRHLALYWSCDDDNKASISVAEKLGFRGKRAFEMLLYRARP